MPDVTLHGYRYSVYQRVARMALHEKGVACGTVEVNPFADLPEGYRDLHPFGRAPVLAHGRFAIYETAAILRYADAAFPGAALTPDAPERVGRMAQVISVADSYAYIPLVRQVFAHRVFRPAEGLAADAATVAEGLARAPVVLGALERIAAEGLVLDGQGLTLADIHLAPMIGYFAQAPEGRAMLASYPALARWWAWVSARESFARTDPGLPERP